MNFKLLASAVMAAAVLSGCSSVTVDYDGHDASRADQFIIPGKTTVTEARAYLGTPTVTAVCKADGEKVYGWALAGHNTAGAIMRGMGKGMVTLGLGAQSSEYTVKNILVKVNADGVVTDYKKNGASYITKDRFTFWNECERNLTDEEVNSPIVYRISEVCPKYAAEVAAKEGIKVEDVDTGKEFEWCNIPCQTRRGVVRAFGEISEMNDLVKAEEGDGSKAIFH